MCSSVRAMFPVAGAHPFICSLLARIWPMSMRLAFSDASWNKHVNPIINFDARWPTEVRLHQTCNLSLGLCLMLWQTRETAPASVRKKPCLQRWSLTRVTHHQALASDAYPVPDKSRKQRLICARHIAKLPKWHKLNICSQHFAAVQGCPELPRGHNRRKGQIHPEKATSSQLSTAADAASIVLQFKNEAQTMQELMV